MEKIKARLKHKPNFKWYLKTKEADSSQAADEDQPRGNTIDVNARQLGLDYLQQAKQYNLRYAKRGQH